MEFDLNQELANESMFGLQALLSELETAHGCIEERIRQLEAVISRATQRQLWRQNQPVSVVPIQARNSETVKKNNTNLVANALSRETDSKKTEKGKEGFFDCNICLEMARDPILTSCGHLFCWPCFYSCSYIGLSEMKECPVCMEKVTDKSIIPIYGNGNVSSSQKSRFEESGLTVPPRPSAHRIEGLRQRFMAPGESNSENTPERSWNVNHVRSQLMRSMLDRSASFSSLSNALDSAMSSANSAMSSAARLIQELEASINSHQATTISRQSSIDVDGDSFSSIAEVSTSVQVNSTTPNSSSSRRRRGVPMNSDVENGRDPTRRRLV